MPVDENAVDSESVRAESSADLELPRRHVMFFAVLVEGSAGVVAVGLGWLFGCVPVELIGWNSAGAAWGVTGALPMLVFFALSVRYPIGPLRKMERLLDEIVVPFLKPCSVPDLAIIALLAGIGEEFLFRGLLQHQVAAIVGTTWGLVGASILFGLAHAVSVTYFVITAFAGVYLGLLWLTSENLLAPIIAHALYDFVALVYVLRFRKKPPRDVEASVDS